MPANVVTASVLAGLAAAAWLYMLLFRGGFWRAGQRLGSPPAPSRWPAVAAVVPARNEAALIGRVVAALAAQDYPGRFAVVVVDDDSDDGTAAAARAAAGEDRLTLVAAGPRPPGWVGKTWAMKRGVDAVAACAEAPEFIWFSDADIEHAPDVLRRLVSKAEGERLDLVSLMARLRADRGWERLLIPAFVFFFQKLYPFAWVADPRRATAAAAGGYMLARRRALTRAGGIEAIKGALIDDCALARALKTGGPIWLGLAERSRGIRPYEGLAGVWSMVARSAYTQLRRSPALLAGTVVGMALLYGVPPLAALAGALACDWPLAGLGALGWGLMGWAYAPTIAYYRQPRPAALGLPLAALFYTLMTLSSARRHWRGEGGGWKGRRYGGDRKIDRV